TTLSASAALFVQSHYANNSIPRLLNFFDRYYSPAWTVLYWLYKLNANMHASVLNSAVQAQALAMFLHMYDDHLSDGDIPIDHLHLQLRTHAWQSFMNLTALAGHDIPDFQYTQNALINDYFAGVHYRSPVEDLATYEQRFRLQTATWIVMPTTLAIPLGGDFMADVRHAYETFALAWRYLDDLRDWQTDAHNREHTAVYFLLNAEHRELWRPGNATELEIIIRQLTPMVKDRIDRYLMESAKTANRIGLPALAAEYEALAAPLKMTTPE
ncbi:MAG: hypothetical protein KDK34_19040, partial [Leptospiraceae bacterium]|nr:hypothetical protein [Leptospiraceae bacterium]